ncbi:hypothetical protein LCGC14_3077020, partial [marine sediment metagenome]
MKWIDKKTPEWANEGKQLIKDWQKQRAEQKNRDKQETKQIKLELKWIRSDELKKIICFFLGHDWGLYSYKTYTTNVFHPAQVTRERYEENTTCDRCGYVIWQNMTNFWINLELWLGVNYTIYKRCWK